MPEKIMHNVVQVYLPRVIKMAQSKVLNKSHFAQILPLELQNNTSSSMLRVKMKPKIENYF